MLKIKQKVIHNRILKDKLNWWESILEFIFYNNNDKEYVYYKLKNHEYFLRSSQSIYFYDFVDIQ